MLTIVPEQTTKLIEIGKRRHGIASVKPKCVFD